MSNYVAAGLILAAVLVLAHVVVALRAHERPLLETAVVLVLSSGGVTTGIKLVVICATEKLKDPFGSEDRIYILLGGLALVWVSIGAIWIGLRPTPDDPAS